MPSRSTRHIIIWEAIVLPALALFSPSFRSVRWLARCSPGFATGKGERFPFSADVSALSWPLSLLLLHQIVRGTPSTVPKIANGNPVATFIGGRFLLSFCSTIATVAAPLYLVEISPPQYRATLAGGKSLCPDYEPANSLTF
jgi:Sugar (and other) transporter